MNMQTECSTTSRLKRAVVDCVSSTESWHLVRVVVVLVLLTTISVTTAGCGKAAAPAAAVVVDSPTHDFGERRQGESLSHTFLATNQMDVPVRIVKALSSCSCIVAGNNGVFPDTTIAPHGTLQIPVRLSIGSVQEVASGRVVVYYRLETVVGENKCPTDEES
jgi:hypothetical protein